MSTLFEDGIACRWCLPQADEASCLALTPGSKPGQTEKYAPTCGRLIYAHRNRLQTLGQLRGWYPYSYRQSERFMLYPLGHHERLQVLAELRGWI